MTSHAQDNSKRCGFVAVLGAPNAGKSTLINALVGTKVSIVSPKVQTTRTIVRGVALHGQAQIVLIDTPGIFSAKKRLERAMVAAAWQGGAEAEMILLVVDAARKHAPDRQTLDIIARLNREHPDVPCALILNKIDEVRPETLLKLTQTLNAQRDFAATFMISALKDKGTRDILPWLAERMPKGPWMFEDDEVSDMPMRLLAAEITREKLFYRLHQELPYALTVETESWENFDDGSIRISQVIYVARDSHRVIILGKGGGNIRAIGEAARKELGEILETTVHLKLFVKVRENWADDPERYALWGLDPRA